MGGLVLRNVGKRFGPVEVIHDLSLEVGKGEFAVFLGPSGCGKSTLLRMVAGLEGLSAGEIHLGPRRIDGLPPGNRGVAMVFQQYALYPHMTVRQNMGFGLRNIGTPAAQVEAKIAQAAALLEIGQLLDRKPGQLSGGQRQRVAIGRAIVKQPEAFLFDEPLSNLDAALRARTRIELARLHQQVPATMVFVTHDQVEAMTLADRIVVMNAGRIEQVGTPVEVYSQPSTAFVAGFIGTPAMNMLPVARIEADGARACAVLSCGMRVATSVSAASLPPAGSGSLVLGIRAEHVIPAPDAAAAQGSPAIVEVVERLGERTLLHARLEDGSLLSYDEPGDAVVRTGDRVRLQADGARAHLFGADGRVCMPPRSAQA